MIYYRTKKPNLWHTIEYFQHIKKVAEDLDEHEKTDQGRFEKISLVIKS